jgi:hypothetical protein
MTSRLISLLLVVIGGGFVSLVGVAYLLDINLIEGGGLSRDGAGLAIIAAVSAAIGCAFSFVTVLRLRRRSEQRHGRLA